MPTFELWHELLWKLELKFATVRFAQHPKEPAETEGRSIFHDRRTPGIPELTRLLVGVFELPYAVDQFVLQRFFARQNSTVRDAIAQTICGQISLFRHHSEKLIICLHDE